MPASARPDFKPADVDIGNNTWFPVYREYIFQAELEFYRIGLAGLPRRSPDKSVIVLLDVAGTSVTYNRVHHD